MKWRALPAYCRNMYAYSKARTKSVPPIEFSRLFFTTYEKYMPGGTAVGHYFLQDIWASKLIYQSGCKFHIDIGSRVDGFVVYRVLIVEQIMDVLNVFNLEKTDFIPDTRNRIVENPEYSFSNGNNFWCGLFVFSKLLISYN